MSKAPDSKEKNVKDASKRQFLKSGTAVAGAPINELTKETKTKQVLGRHNSSAPNSMSRRTFVKVAAGGAAVVGLAFAVSKSLPEVKAGAGSSSNLVYKGKITQADRLEAVAERPKPTVISPTVVPAPGGTEIGRASCRERVSTIV